VVPVKTSHQGERRKAQTQAAEPPEVGIFWLVDGKLVIDRTALSKAENYGAFKVHPGDHCSVWEMFQRGGTVPADIEYEECPRGRVMYDTKTGRFRLLADRCILSLSNDPTHCKNPVAQILASNLLQHPHTLLIPRPTGKGGLAGNFRSGTRVHALGSFSRQPPSWREENRNPLYFKRLRDSRFLQVLRILKVGPVP
jgi:hypothetical protein